MFRHNCGLGLVWQQAVQRRPYSPERGQLSHSYSRGLVHIQAGRLTQLFGTAQSRLCFPGKPVTISVQVSGSWLLPWGEALTQENEMLGWVTHRGHSYSAGLSKASPWGWSTWSRMSSLPHGLGCWGHNCSDVTRLWTARNSKWDATTLNLEILKIVGKDSLSELESIANLLGRNSQFLYNLSIIWTEKHFCFSWQ
jgi:hypothetical protein